MEEIIEGVAAIMNAQTAKYEARIASLEAAVARHQLMLEPPPATGLPNPWGFQYMAMTFFDNKQSSPGKSRFVITIDGNLTKKSGKLPPDFRVSANMSTYAKFIKSFTVDQLDERDRIAAKIKNFADVDNVLFGTISTKGGKQGTTKFAGQWLILGTDGAPSPRVESGGLLVDDHPIYATSKWLMADPKTGQPWKGNIVSRSFCYPLDDLARQSEGDGE